MPHVGVCVTTRENDLAMKLVAAGECTSLLKIGEWRVEEGAAGRAGVLRAS